MKENAPKEALPFGKPNKPIDFVGFFKRYGLFVLGIGAFLFTLTVPVVLLISKPNYEVHALMRIDPIIPSLITKSEDLSIINYYSDYANTQSRRMMNLDVLETTVKKLTKEQKASIFPPNLPSATCAEIASHLIKVNPVPGTHLVEIAVSGPKKKGLAPLINDLMLSYLEKVRKGNEMQDNERLVYLRDEKQALSNDIAAIAEKLNLLTQNISTADFGENNNMASKKAEELQQAAVNAFTERVSSENQFKEAEKNSQQLKKLSLDPMVEEMVVGDQSLHFTSSWTYQQQQQLRSTTDGLTPNNPDRIYVEQRMKAMRDYEKKLQNEVRSSAKMIVYGKRDYEQKKELIQTGNKAEKAKNTEDELLKELDKTKQESVRISLGLHLGEALKATLKHKRDLLDQIDTRIHELELEGKAPLHIAIESLAREPDAPAGSNTKKLLMIFAGISFGGVTMLFFVFDFLDNRIRRKEDIKAALGYPPAKEILKSGEEKLFHHILKLAPGESAAKEIRSLAVKLAHENQVNGSKVILFSGVDRKTGATSIAMNCARALSELVPKVLLIEAAANMPPLSELNELGHEPEGLQDLLAGSGSPEDLIVKGVESSLDILCHGKAASFPISQQRIPEILSQLKEAYDFICIDCLPVLESTMTEHLALHADIVTLIALGESTMYRDLRAAAEVFVRLEVPAIMPILNWGGPAKNSAIDSLLEDPPEFLQKLGIAKLESFIKNLPPAQQMLDTMQQKLKTFARSAKSGKSGTPKKK
jgi:succinoglycan biosynthesis transport protein ExoP